MRTKKKIYIAVLCIVYCVLCIAFCQAEDRFIYDAQGRRDPFIPLVDKSSSTGLRTSFVPPDLEVRLPVDIKVKGILSKDDEYFAIINDKVMKKGQNIGEIKIKRIEKDKVILKYGQKDFTVYLKRGKVK